MQATNVHRYLFDGFVVDLDRASLFREGEEVRLRPQSFAALKFLVECRGRLATKDELMAALWPRAVVTDDSLVKCIREVRAALANDSRSYIKTVPRRGYIFDAPVVELDSPAPLAAAGSLAPAGETEANGSQHDAEEGRPALLSAAGKEPIGAIGRLAWLLAVAVALAVVVAWLLRNHAEKNTEVLANSIAVLPFENLSPDPDNAYFAAGIHEAVLNQLAKLEQVNAISRTSMLRYADRQQSIRDMADALNVETVMEGSVRYADGRVVVTAQLIDPETGVHLWSEEYDRPFADIFAIQADIASRIAAAFEAELSASEMSQLEKRPTVSPDAYQLYLKGRYHWDKWLHTEVERSIAYYERAIEIDPEFALAYAGLADAYTALHGLGTVAPREVMPKAKRAAARALEIDESLAEAHVSMGLIRHFYDWDYAGGDASFLRAIALAPNSATAHHLYGKNLPVTSSFDEALQELEHALELEPYSVGINKDLAETLYYGRRYDEAITTLERTLELEPGYSIAYFWLTRCYEAKDRRGDAMENHRTFRSLLPPEFAGSTAQGGGYSGADWDGYWQEYLRQLDAEARQQFVDPYRLVEVHARLGNKEEAFDWLETCFRERCSWIPTLGFDPLLDSLRGDARFADLMKRAGLDRRAQVE
ncbi:MAG: tetratricopeptide repeat protein [Woeseiaceae bacterium]